MLGSGDGAPPRRLIVRRLGLAIGVAVLIAVLGSPGSPAGQLDAYRRAWLVIAGIALAAGFVGIVALRSRPAPAGAAVVATP